MMKTAFEIRKLARSIVILVLLSVLHAAPAHAQNVLSWVSHTGSDSNDCAAATTACLTFQGALGKTLSGGEITCLDFGGFGAMNVTASVTIDCRATGAAVEPSGCGQAILINAPGMVVSLRGLTVTNDTNCNVIGAIEDGIFIGAAAAIFIEDCVVQNHTANGIIDSRTTGLTKLVIKNTIVRNNGTQGIQVTATATNSAVLENVHSVGNSTGIAVGAGNNVVISRSVVSENSDDGIFALPGAQVVVDNTEISHNVSDGIGTLGTVTLANSDISFNNSSIFGTVMSYGNNRIFGNGSGARPTLIGQQ